MRRFLFLNQNISQLAAGMNGSQNKLAPKGILRSLLRSSLFLILLLFLFFIKPSTVFASSESIQNFDSRVVASKDGSFQVVEIIVYDFGNNARHGIFRNIPTASKVGDLYRTIEIDFSKGLRDGVPETYSITDSSGKASVKIGNPTQTITGIHTYTINYRVKNGIGSNYSDHDEIYWNITGNEWQVPILSASVTLRTDFGVSDNNTVCYTGVLGSKNKDCLLLESFPTVIKTSKALNPGEGLTAVWSFPVGTFPKSTLQPNIPLVAPPDTIANKVLPWILGIGWISLNLILAPGLVIWYFKRKRKKRFGLPVPNFDFPKDDKGKRLIPAEAGTIDTAKLEQDDVTATIFDLAIRKYVKIIQVKEKSSILGVIDTSKDNYAIEKLKDYSDTCSFEKALLDRLFRDGSMVSVSSLRIDFYKTFDELGKEIFGMLVAKLCYTKNPAFQRGLLFGAAIVTLSTLNVSLAGVLFFLSRKLNGRTALGDDIDYKIDGLKLFLKNMSRNYKWQAEKLYTVEKMIPYAIALGYIDKFMEQLKIAYPDYNPDWYTGNLAFYFVSSSLFNSFNSDLTMASPSSSGFGGGGFSGGGGGGGGGGSW
ncbi:MAG: DUF2207 domain-containing protein [bacterium]|nr:DUF2207 domain-containing protein [bacterium]